MFWTLPTAWLSGTAAAGAIALINSIGNLAGFGGPYLIGWVKEATGNTSTGLLVLAVLPLIGGLLVFLGGHETKTEFAGRRSEGRSPSFRNARSAYAADLSRCGARSDAIARIWAVGPAFAGDGDRSAALPEPPLTLTKS